MKRFAILYFVLFINFFSSSSQEYSKNLFEANGEIYFKFEIEDEKDLFHLTKIVSIDNVNGTNVFAYANEKEFVTFLKQEINYTILPHPNEDFNPQMANFEQIKNAKTWDFYPTYEAYVALMYQFETDYPDLCDVFSIGQSINGREILVAKISDNVVTDEDEPEFFYTSSMHGDELTGFPLMLNLIDTLLDNYGTVTRMTNLVDNIEIYINPLANPDGTYTNDNSTVAGATRYNANGIDLNRNYPDPDPNDGPHPDGNAWQTETIHFMNFAESRHFVMSANFHGGEEVCNYPWDTWSYLNTDDDWWQYISHEYADTAQLYSPSTYMDGFNDGITNGYAWYPVAGGRQDYMNYFHQCREETFEISMIKLIPAAQLEDHWEYNRRSLLNYMEQCLYGMRGIVTNANTGQPIEAEIYILNHEVDSSWVYSSLPVGNYHRPIFAGTYEIQVSAPCYQTQVFQNVIVQNGIITILDVQMQPADVEFTANKTTAPIGGSINFSDVSCSNPTSWQWTFEGGAPSSSNLQNPTGIIYNSVGTYSVKLVISDGVFTDSLTKLDYISVNEEYLIANESVTTCSGVFYDSEGPNNNYTDDEVFVMTFHPSSLNGIIKIEFTEFDIEYHSSCSYDFLKIYNGPDVSATEIGTYCGTNSPGIILSTHETGALTFLFYSDESVTAPGWEAIISCEIEPANLDLSVFLEGPFNGNDMNLDLKNLDFIPLDQPYDIAPWGYNGTENVISVPSYVVDWVLVEIRDALDAASATEATMLAQKAAFVLNDGSIVGLDGNSSLQFNNSIAHQLFVVISHRNHLSLMSAFPIIESDGIYSYDFTSVLDQAYGTNAQKNLGSGLFGMFAGDANADGIIDNNDGSESWNLESGKSGYLGSDVNLNGQSNNQDKNNYWYFNFNKTTQVPQ